MKALEQVYEQLKPEEVDRQPDPGTTARGRRASCPHRGPHRTAAGHQRSVVDAARRLCRSPQAGSRPRAPQGVFDDRDERAIDWATAEELAYASILADGIPIRLTGEDVQRGTFSHRHAAFRDVETGAIDIPLQRLPQAQASFEIHNSPLSDTRNFKGGGWKREPWLD